MNNYFICMNCQFVFILLLYSLIPPAGRCTYQPITNISQIIGGKMIH